jgi:hypothetical protein
MPAHPEGLGDELPSFEAARGRPKSKQQMIDLMEYLKSV